MKKQSKGMIAAIVVAVIAGCTWYFTKSSPKAQLVVKTEKIVKGDISNIVTATGSVEAITQVEVGTQVSGIIDKIYVDFNSVVKKGQLIAELDKELLLSELSSVNADMSSAKTEYEYQKKNFERTEQLYKKELVSETDYETANYTYQKAKNAYEKSKFNVEKAKRNLSYAMIKSPIDGVVISRAVDEGQTVAASYSTPTLFTIANDLSKMQVVANVDEADLGEVKEGQRVSFTVDAYPNDVFEGVVTQVRLQATTTSNVVTYEVIVNAPNPDLKLKPGLTANISIFTTEKKGILLVPAKAFRFTPTKELLGENAEIVPAQQKGGKDAASHTIWQKNGDVFQAKNIVVGESNGVSTEIVSGLKEGEDVVVEVTASSETDAAKTADSSKSGETSPFMPQRPGANKNKK
ncbi:MAG: efflux RND transporter periplasmic adaptor subunit [Bacteroidales bacterium]|jgi:HlyD family secretion protein|nr:efflux RND transporter periplasmic adaptor subunit [Bacteroidales bacterium]MDD3162179.1 efflux RND transporter periplasmic adaptor subunit [Bacteroidales bacterium]